MADAPLTAEQIAEIAARAEAATKGPWGTYNDGTGLIDIAADLQDTGHGYRCRRYVGQLEADQIDNDPTHTDWDEDQDRAQVAADAAFVAHAREDVPALLADLERLSRPSYSERHVWQVWNEHDSSTHALYATEDDAKTGTIECWEEVEESCPDYSWQPARGDHSLELLVGGEPAGIYLTRQDVHGKAVAQ